MCRKTQQGGRGKPGRRCESGFEVALSISTGNRIDGERHDVKFRCSGPLQKSVVQSPILVKIELKHLRPRRETGDIFNRDCRKGRYAEHGAEFGGRFGDRPLALMVEQSLQRRRGAV